MRKVIKGKVYDTGKARYVGGFDRGDSLNTDYESQELFCKRTGEYFLYTIGGSETKYAKKVGQEYRAGSIITPLTYEQAEEWARENIGSEYEHEFGEHCGNADVMLSIRVPASTYLAIKRASQRSGKTMRETITDMVKVYESF